VGESHDRPERENFTFNETHLTKHIKRFSSILSKGTLWKKLTMEILREASEEHGERFASQLEGVADSHFPKRYGEEGLRVEWGYDYLDSFWKEPMRIRKDGKAHRQDIKSRKSYLIHNRGFELEGHCECGCEFTKKSQKLRKNSFYYEYPEYDRRK
jgi:hypothetical protein